ncbi:MAG: HAD family hydrolase [Candidatus Hodarchaeota archaeon]
MKIKIISFDVTGTIVNDHYLDFVWLDVVPQLYAQERNISLASAKIFVHEEYDRMSKDDIRWYLPEYWFNHFQLSRDPMDVFKEYRDLVKIYPEVPSVLEILSKEYDLIVASGLPKNLLEFAIEDIRTYFKHFFSPVTDLGEVRKSVGFYEMICKTLKIEPRSVLHIGDNWDSDYVVPRKFGMMSLFLDRTGKRKGKYIIETLKEVAKYL